MKTLTAFILVFMTFLSYGQEYRLTVEKAPFKTVYNRNIDSIRILNIESGHYTIYFDTSLTSLKARYTIKNGRLEGKYMEWFPDGQVRKDIEFKNGLFHGIHKESLILDGYYLTNIARWINGAEDKNIQMEW